jgi:hypothetical protein
MAAFSYQGISDQVAYEYMEKHGRATWRQIKHGLVSIADCRCHLVSPKLCLDLINQGWGSSEATDGMNQPDGMVDCQTLRILNFRIF